MEEETDTKYERDGDMLKSSSGKKALKFSIDTSKFNFWSLFDKEFIFLKDAWSGYKGNWFFYSPIFPFIPKYSRFFPIETQSVDILFPKTRKCKKEIENYTFWNSNILDSTLKNHISFFYFGNIIPLFFYEFNSLVIVFILFLMGI